MNWLSLFSSTVILVHGSNFEERYIVRDHVAVNWLSTSYSHCYWE